MLKDCCHRGNNAKSVIKSFMTSLKLINAASNKMKSIDANWLKLRMVMTV